MIALLRILGLVALALLCSSRAASVEVITPEEEEFGKIFIAAYREKHPMLLSLMDKISKKISQSVFSLSYWVPPEYTFRLKDPESLEVKLRQRLKTDSYTSYQQVFEKMHDYFGMRLTTFFPSLEIPAIVNLLNLTDGVDMVNVKYGEGEYRGTNIHARVDGIDVEIQLRGAFHHGFYQINHKFDYKPKDGKVLPQEERQLLDELKFHSFAAEEALAKLLALHKVPTPKLKRPGEKDEMSEWSGVLSYYKKMDEERQEKKRLKLLEAEAGGEEL